MVSTTHTKRFRLRNEDRIGDEVMHRTERDLDLKESRLES
jgi:hypothetical protein